MWKKRRRVSVTPRRLTTRVIPGIDRIQPGRPSRDNPIDGVRWLPTSGEVVVTWLIEDCSNPSWMISWREIRNPFAVLAVNSVFGCGYQSDASKAPPIPGVKSSSTIHDQKMHPTGLAVPNGLTALHVTIGKFCTLPKPIGKYAG